MTLQNKNLYERTSIYKNIEQNFVLSSLPKILNIPKDRYDDSTNTVVHTYSAGWKLIYFKYL